MNELLSHWLLKLISYLPALSVGAVALYFMQRGRVVPAAILISVAAVLALCAMVLREPPDSPSTEAGKKK